MNMSLFDKITIQIAGENALIIYFGDQPNAKISKKIQQAEQLIRQQMTDDIIDLVPSYASIMVLFNIMNTDHHKVRSKLRSVLHALTHNADNVEKIQRAKLVELPVYYSQESGPDLRAIAEQAGLNPEQVIDIHQAQEYLVYAIGFAPGFAYLGEVDERIATPRLSSPRLKVPKGAVAIADRQTAVYPSISPGGWNIIGLCPVDMFNANASPIMPVQVGDKVKFKAISKTEFIALGGILPIENGEGK
ncbi:MAG: 5-oxoprolinase subunit PxpB [Colwellia sp.]|nr:5-oxoprolinase subunit PxpB [Colwellia sp.]